MEFGFVCLVVGSATVSRSFEFEMQATSRARTCKSGDQSKRNLSHRKRKGLLKEGKRT